MLVEIPREPVSISLPDGQILEFQIEQQSIRETAQFVRAFDKAIRSEEGAINLGFAEQLLASAPEVEELLVSILLPVPGGDRMTIFQAREVPQKARLSILMAQIQLNRLDEMMPGVLHVFLEIQAARVQRALDTISAACETGEHGNASPS
ncbi:MAG: hypothetical protein U0931_04995 [Vulcanimicrobiota bacterium]